MHQTKVESCLRIGALPLLVVDGHDLDSKSAIGELLEPTERRFSCHLHLLLVDSQPIYSHRVQAVANFEKFKTQISFGGDLLD